MMNDPVLQVRFESAMALSSILKQKNVKELLKGNILSLLKIYIKLMEETDLEEIMDSLQEVVQNFTEESKEIFECPICFKSSKNYPDLIYSRSKCKHVLCNVCWSGWFTEKFECPICKAKARPKTLKRIIFVK